MTPVMTFWVFIVSLVIISLSLWGLWKFQKRIERREALAAGLIVPDEKSAKRAKQQAPTLVQQNFLNQVAQPSMHPSPYGIAATAIEPVKPATPMVNRKLQDIPPWERKHTGLAGATDSGKTATMNTCLVNDIRRGAHCVVCSTHYTAYHPEDQQIDLRGITHLFEVAYTPETILAAIVAAARRIDERLALYRDGKDVGQDTVLYLGEWGSISRNLGKEADTLIQKILDEGRKTKVWVVIELHSAIVGRFGGDSGLRQAFKTRLAHTVDKTTWAAFVGKEIEHQPVALGYWMTSNGLIAFDRPTPELINAMAQTMLPNIHEYLLPVSHGGDDASSARADDPADFTPGTTSSFTDDRMLLSALIDGIEPVAPKVAQAALLEEKPQFKPVVLSQFDSELEQGVAALLSAGMGKNAIIRTLQWPDGLRSKKPQLDFIDAVAKKMAA